MAPEIIVFNPENDDIRGVLDLFWTAVFFYKDYVDRIQSGNYIRQE
jgi:hypothetical protein